MSQHTCIHTSNHSSPYNATHGYIMPRADLGTKTKYQKKGPLCRGSIRHGPPDSSLAGANRVGHTRTQSTRTRTSTHANAHASTHACSQLCLRVLLPRHCGDIPPLRAPRPPEHAPRKILIRGPPPGKKSSPPRRPPAPAKALMPGVTRSPMAAPTRLGDPPTQPRTGV